MAKRRRKAKKSTKADAKTIVIGALVDLIVGILLILIDLLIEKLI